MRHLLIIGLIAFAGAFASLARAQQPAAGAQQPTANETEILTGVAKCLLLGLPSDWYEAKVIVTLDEPGSPNGEARYVYTPQLARADEVPYVPCHSTNPAKALVEMRALQPPERRGWKSVRFLLHRNGTFDLTYDYPKAESKN